MRDVSLHSEVVLHDVVVGVALVGRELRASGKAGNDAATTKWIGNGGEKNGRDVVDWRVEEIRDGHLHLQRKVSEDAKAAADGRLVIADGIPGEANARLEVVLGD